MQPRAPTPQPTANVLHTQRKRVRVLHVEAGESYGGSLRALESYLQHTADATIIHDLLLFYPVVNGQPQYRIRNLWVLHSQVKGTTSDNHSAFRRGLRKVARSTALRCAVENLLVCLRAFATIPTALRISRLIRRHRYDLIHVNNTFTYQLPTMLAAWFNKVPILAHVRNPVEDALYSRVLARMTQGLATVNKSFVKQLHQWTGAGRVRCCPDSVEFKEPDAQITAELRAALGREAQLLVGSVGRLDRQKGYVTLIRAASLVCKSKPDIRFVVAGEGPLRQTLERLIGEAGLEGRFTLCGFREDIHNVIGTLDLFVSSSVWEGLPLAILEAMAMGKPIVATAVGGNAELVIPGVTGELTTPSDPEGLAQAILVAVNMIQAKAYSQVTARHMARSWGNPTMNALEFDDAMWNVIRYQRITSLAPEGVEHSKTPAYSRQV